MRLINTKYLRLEEHNDLQLPFSGYAILSHRWYASHEEVSYHDLESGRDVSHKKGFHKLKTFCGLAQSMGYDYAWSDTCCINKDSATELGTALNSMYRWYADSKICIAYLADVHRIGRSFEKSEWFSRGWTLQELIAPKFMSFFDHDWHHLGTKSERLDQLSQITGIQASVLAHTIQPKSCSVAQRMSWAAGRHTERVEDRAYSLLGVFGISLEMIYGERENAFIRLQEKILQQSADQSIFTWSLDLRNHPSCYSGMLAPSPDSFVACTDIVPTSEDSPFSLSNIGLSISLFTQPYAIETYFAFLNCRSEKESNSRIAILVARLPRAGQWARVMNEEGTSTFSRLRPAGMEGAIEWQIHVRQIPTELPLYLARAHGIWLRKIELAGCDTSSLRILSNKPTRKHDCVYIEQATWGIAGIVSVKPTKDHRTKASQIRWIDVGFDDEFRPRLMIANIDYANVRSLSQRSGAAFDEAMTFGQTSTAHSRIFKPTWLENFCFEATELSSSGFDIWDSGMCVAGFDEDSAENPIYRTLGETHIRYRFSLQPEPCLRGRSPEPSERHKQIWTLDIIEHGRSPIISRRSLTRRAKRDEGKIVLSSAALLVAWMLWKNR